MTNSIEMRSSRDFNKSDLLILMLKESAELHKKKNKKKRNRDFIIKSKQKRRNALENIYYATVRFD